MYSRFIFSNFDNQDLKKKARHQYGAFVDIFDGTNINNILWYSKLRIHQAKLKSQEQNNATDMVALVPQSSTISPPSLSSANTANNKPAPWDTIPSSFDLNFSVIDPTTEEPLPQYSFPYYSSYFHNKSQLLHLETRIDPFSNVRKYNNFDKIFSLPNKFNLDFYSKEDIKHLLYFIPGETFHSRLIDHLPVQHFGFFLLHIVSTKVLVPVTNTMVLSLLEHGLPGDPSSWGDLITDMKFFLTFLNVTFLIFFAYRVLIHQVQTLKKLNHPIFTF
mgnify:CR=1 FL=1